MPRTVFLLSTICVAIALAACSPLPKFARPQVIDDPDFLKKEDVILYRPLTREDFKGVEPPRGFDQRMAAAVCAYIEPEESDGRKLAIEYLGTTRGKHQYSVNHSEMTFSARVDRDCSWWNPGNAQNQLPANCILQHEQVHFALFEIAAREMSREFRAMTFRISGTDTDSLKQDLEKQVQRFFRQRMDRLVRENFEFDEQTSAKFDPLRQMEWLVMAADKLQDRSIVEQWQCDP
jgi:hypothetical protein